ncbi:hypothetical protein GCM10011534_05710 [Pseudooceanicola nanhaiensis]|uniref:Uncharacterized protein n=1 Tax=Pseudooceanicola nanhaiensis TaxID=375761 RepID=A0A917W9S3_9RHOB|nr:hypothetical protein GCM10011534_05710 [Pseudooceanicola nanhaiensis]
MPASACHPVGWTGHQAISPLCVTALSGLAPPPEWLGAECRALPDRPSRLIAPPFADREGTGQA